MNTSRSHRWTILRPLAIAALLSLGCGPWMGCRSTDSPAPLWGQAAESRTNPWAEGTQPPPPQTAAAPQFAPPQVGGQVQPVGHYPPLATGATGVSLATVDSAAMTDPLTSPDDDLEQASLLRKTMESLGPKAVLGGAKSAAGLGPDEGVARESFQAGQAAFAQRQFAEAAKHFEKAAKRWPDSALEEDATFMLAESYFFSDQYPKANDAYSRLLEKFSGSRHLDRIMQRQFAIARFWQQAYQDNFDLLPNFTDGKRPRLFTGSEAQATLTSVWMNDPRGPLADDALMESANGHFLAGRYYEAADLYRQLRTDHAQSPHQLQAHLLGLQSVLRTYQGPEYDGAALVESEKLIESILAQFGHQLGPERDRVLQTRQAVREQLAEREWTQGQHNDKLKYYGAAAYYYHWLIEQYPETEHAALARQRLLEIKDLPPRPADRFAWLTRIFGDRR